MHPQEASEKSLRTKKVASWGGLGEEPAALLPTACLPSSLQRDKVLTGPSEYGRFQQEQTSSSLPTLVLTEVPGGFANPTRGILMEGNKTPC